MRRIRRISSAPENALNPNWISHDHPHRRPPRPPPRPSVCRRRGLRVGHRRRIRRSLRRRADAHAAEQDGLWRALRADEEPSARRLARDGRAALYAGAKHSRAHDRRVRDLVRHLDPAPRRGFARQWRRPPDHERVRAVQNGAAQSQPQCGRRHRSGRDPRGRRAGNAERRSSRNDRPRPARRRRSRSIPRS